MLKCFKASRKHLAIIAYGPKLSTAIKIWLIAITTSRSTDGSKRHMLRLMMSSLIVTFQGHPTVRLLKYLLGRPEIARDIWI